MSTTILATKLYLPPLRPTGVLRSRLVERLNKGLHRKVTLISAPAGSGKTTLLSEWLTAPAGLPRRKVAWLSLDEGDSDPTRFLTYLVAAIRTVAPSIGEGVLDALQSSQATPLESVLAALLNEITTLSDNFVLVLDDYHLVDAKAVDDALIFMIEHLPSQMHLVIGTREDPRFPLARLRSRDQLTELRGADLRFTPSEAAGFLQAMNLELSAEDVAALEKRTEGWVAGLQLAALSMQGQQDVSGFIQAFAGDHRYIVDYLVEEVLQRQPKAVRSFLLQTAILDELNGLLCDAVTGQEESKARLEALERGNFFLVSLDNKRHWYRYHHLFADVLQVHLMAEYPDQIPTLHRRASLWYEQHGSADNAIRHALVAKDFERAANLIELAIPDKRKSRQEATLLGWLKAIPDALIRLRPVLNVEYVGVLMSNGEQVGVENRLREVEEWLEKNAELPARLHPENSQTAETTDRNEEELRRLPYMLAVYRSGYSLSVGNVPDTVKYARRALELLPKEEQFWRGAAAALLGLAYWTNGDLEAAYRNYADGMANLEKVGFISDAIGGAIAPANIRIVQGRLREAMRIYERGLELAVEQGIPAIRGTADMYVGISELLAERDELNAAMQQLTRSKEQGEHTGFPQNRYRWRVAMARIRQAQGDLDAALTLLNEAERLYVSDFHPNVRPVAALKTRAWLAQGRLGEALGWVRERGLSSQDDLSYLAEFEHITLARVLLARYQSERTEHTVHEALAFLERLLQSAEAGGRNASVIEIRIVQALAHHAQGDTTAALVPLQQAMTLAEPEGYFRIFVDQGLPMAQMLHAAAERGFMPAYTARLLTALGVEQPQRGVETPRATFTTPHPTTSQPLTSQPTLQPTSQPIIEPLSERELEVLRLFATELSGPEIADQLVIALSTVRTHTKGIYSKLNVNSRREAVKRAEELHLI